MENMQALLKEVGRGKKGAKDLSFEQAKRAAELILSGVATEGQTAAFLMAERIKSETAEELHAFVEVARAHSNLIAHTAGHVLDCAGPYDGRAKSYAATIPVAAILASAGVPVVLHGSASLPPKYGTSVLEMLHALGVPVSQDGEQIGQQLLQTKMAFVATEKFCSPFERLRPLREDFGMRTLFNTVEKYLNLAHAEYLVAGVFHTSALEKSAELVQRLGYRKAMIVQGVDGSEDVPVSRPSSLYVVEAGTMEKHLIDPKAYGVHAESESVHLSAKEQADRTERVLQGGAGSEQHPELRNMVLLNSGLRLWLTERVSSVVAGIEQARALLDSGQALAKMNEWRES